MIGDIHRAIDAREVKMPLPLEFVVAGRPVSLQASSWGLRRWREQVGSAAQKYWIEAPINKSDIMVTILCFLDGARPDVDNIPKPILDALKGLVYDDDSLVSDLICRVRHISGDAQRVGNLPLLVRQSLGDLDEFLYVRLEVSPGLEAPF